MAAPRQSESADLGGCIIGKSLTEFGSGREKIAAISDLLSVRRTFVRSEELGSGVALSTRPRSLLMRLAAWTDDRNLSCLVLSIGMIVMLLWAGSYKITAPGAEGITHWFLTAR